MSPILILPSQRPGRRTRASPLDPNPDTFFGDAIIQKQKGTTRIFFQNVKGLSSSTLGEDYRYYLSCMKAYEIDIAGLAETNTCWSHPHLRSDFCSILRRQYLQSKVTFGSPSKTIDPCPTTETFQSGGSLTLVTDSMVSCVNGEIDLVDNTGLGRWSGVSFMGRDNTRLTIITAYRVCSGSPRTAPLGSAFLREYNHFLTQNKGHNNPRREFLIDLQSQIQRLQASGHMIILMMDANATMETDSGFDSFLRTCNLVDLHQHSPAPSTYIGAASRRIDFMFGCLSVQQYVTRSGTLSYYEGPQSDHRGMYIDVCVNELFHHNSSKILPPSQRSLHTGNPEHVIKYHASMLRYYNQHNMIQRISQLYQTHHGKSRSEVRELLTKWDNDQGRAMELSERILRKPPKKYRWSPELRNSAIIRRYWKLRLREATNMQLNYTESFLRWQQQVQAHDPSLPSPPRGQPLSGDYPRTSQQSYKSFS
ncbi:hypothetical protein MHU86_16185 [Fragilaria crotonensis]|nr:hypothetical protein MHU86_16185 [Fragilaria crotonensis]